MLPFIVFVELTIINSTEVKFQANREKGNFSRQTSSEVKPGQVGLDLYFKSNLL